MAEELIDIYGAAKLSGYQIQSLYTISKRDKNFPAHVKTLKVPGNSKQKRLWRKSDIAKWSDARRRRPRQKKDTATVPATRHHFLTGQFDREDQRLKTLCKRQTARINHHASRCIHVSGDE